MAAPDDPARDELVEYARRATRERLGSALERKASDAFCVAVISESQVSGGGGASTGGFGAFRLSYRLEELAKGHVPSARGAIGTVGAVVEFSTPREEELAERIRERVERTSEEQGVTESLTPAVRQAGIEAAREQFYQSIGTIRDHIERSTTALAPRGEATGVTTGPVQACWLNHTVRADSDATVLADIASDSAVQRIDVPRQLQAETVTHNVILDAVASVRAAQSLTGAGVTVGVIDSEVADGHPALKDRVIHRRNYTREPFNVPDSHGTAVAGFVGANSDAFTGVAPDVTIYNYKVLATVSGLNSDDFGGTLAIQHALEDGIRVINCSWRAGPNGDGTSREARACDTAWRLGLTIVKSAGNEGPAAATLTTPADAEGVIAVGATDQAGAVIADYSSRGPTTDGRHRPHLVAPGGTLAQGLIGLTVGGGVGDVGAGTSYAAPHVTGLLALLLQRHPTLTPDQQRQKLLAACSPLAGAVVDEQGQGLIDPASLLS
ncbi:MAG: S8 family serine peptidase [Polyangiaceae bacterium]|nr:S8 family serine peptidase [Polyangiaceae bacterium]